MKRDKEGIQKYISIFNLDGILDLSNAGAKLKASSNEKKKASEEEAESLRYHLASWRLLNSEEVEGKRDSNTVNGE